MNVIESTREASYDRSVESIMHSAEIFAMDMKVTDDLELDQNIYSKIVDEISGDRPNKGQVYINKYGEVALSLRYGEYCYTKSYGEKSYYKEKTEGDCITPFYYLKKAVVVDADKGEQLLLEGPINRDEIEKIVTVATNVVPESVLGSWDVTADSKGNVNENITGKVMAWYKDEDNDGLYEVYIGQEGGVKANPASGWLFSYLTNLTEIDLSKLDTSNVTNMYMMFNGCSSLTSLDLSSFATSNVTGMRGMFIGCSSLINLDLSSFNTSNVNNMHTMFYGCEKLTSLDLSNFDTNKVTNMQSMFNGCSGLTSLNVSSFATSNVKSMGNMFNGCCNLTEIIVSDKWNTDNADTENMFWNCGTDHVTVK